MREEGELPLRSLLKSRANPASLLMSVKTLSPYLQRTIPVLPVFDLLSVTLKLTLDESLWGEISGIFIFDCGSVGRHCRETKH